MGGEAVVGGGLWPVSEGAFLRVQVEVGVVFQHPMRKVGSKRGLGQRGLVWLLGVAVVRVRFPASVAAVAGWASPFIRRNTRVHSNPSHPLTRPSHISIPPSPHPHSLTPQAHTPKPPNPHPHLRRAQGLAALLSGSHLPLPPGLPPLANPLVSASPLAAALLAPLAPLRGPFAAFAAARALGPVLAPAVWRSVCYWQRTLPIMARCVCGWVGVGVGWGGGGGGVGVWMGGAGIGGGRIRYERGMGSGWSVVGRTQVVWRCAGT